MKTVHVEQQGFPGISLQKIDHAMRDVGAKPDDTSAPPVYTVQTDDVAALKKRVRDLLDDEAAYGKLRWRVED